MANFNQQLKKARRLTENRLSKDLFKFIRKIEKDILDLEKKRISEDSKDIFGNPIGYYSPVTDAITNGRKAAGSPFTGIDRGDWFKGFFMQEVSGVLRFSSTDPKNSAILNSATSEWSRAGWLSDQLFGLSDDDLKALIQTRLVPFFIKNFRDNLNI